MADKRAVAAGMYSSALPNKPVRRNTNDPGALSASEGSGQGAPACSSAWPEAQPLTGALRDDPTTSSTNHHEGNSGLASGGAQPPYQSAQQGAPTAAAALKGSLFDSARGLNAVSSADRPSSQSGYDSDTFVGKDGIRRWPGVGMPEVRINDAVEALKGAMLPRKLSIKHLNVPEGCDVNKYLAICRYEPTEGGMEEGWDERWRTNGRGRKICEDGRSVGHMAMQLVNAGLVQWGDYTDGGDWMGWERARGKHDLGVQCKIRYEATLAEIRGHEGVSEWKEGWVEAQTEDGEWEGTMGRPRGRRCPTWGRPRGRGGAYV